MINEYQTNQSKSFDNNWQVDFKQAVKTTKELEEASGRLFPDVEYPLFIPRPYLYKILELGTNSVLGKQFLPQPEENFEFGEIDPIGDQIYSQGSGVIHRYHNRILYSPTEICPIQCRYCFRKNELGNKDPVFKGQLERALEYIRNNPEVEEVILTGGDPLILGDAKLDFILNSFAHLSQIKMIRLHTRTPVILPNRINQSFIELLKKIKSKVQILTIVIHTNHILEWTTEFKRAINLLRGEPFNVLSQSVLLKDINDDPLTLKRLFMGLVSLGVQPYYLHHPDNVKGAQHFRLSLQEGRLIYRELKAITSGFILPKYVVELPNGKGKALAYSDQKNLSTWTSHDGHEVHCEIY